MKFRYLSPIVSVFHSDGSIDPEGNRRVYRYMMDNGIEGFLVMGSTGEFYAMTMEERRQMIDISSEALAGKTLYYVGTGAMNPDDAVELSRYALKKGADGVFVVAPYYLPMSERDLFAYYDYVAERIDGPMYIYNIPSCTCQDVTPSLVLSLCRKHPNIRGIKDSVIDFAHLKEILAAIRPEFPYFEAYTGMDFNFVSDVGEGGAGCIGGLANLAPEVCAAMTSCANEGRIEEMVALQQKIVRLIPAYNLGGKAFIATLKRGMQLRGVDIADKCKFPVQPIAPEEEAALREMFTAEGLL